MKSLAESSFLVAGCVRNAQKTIEKDIERFEKSLKTAKSLEFILIESDSKDSTVKRIQEINSVKKNIRLIQLGDLEKNYKERTDRLAFCRNKYLDLIISDYKHIDFVVISDFDNLNKKLSYDSVISCWDNTDWDMCSANQNGPYYDIYALRHNLWNPKNAFEQVEFFNNFINIFKSYYLNVYSKMIKIPFNNEWIQVESSFGGFAIYKKECFEIGARYIGNENGIQICEHVPFNKTLVNKNFKLFINPKLINASLTDHTRILKWYFLPYFIIKKLLKNFF